jgi:hypothetical protein
MPDNPKSQGGIVHTIGYRRSGDLIEINQGYTEFHLLPDDPRYHPVRSNNPRGKITSFSRKSRSRFIKKCLRKLHNPNACFDFTFPDEFFDGVPADQIGRKTYIHLKKLMQWAERKFKTGALWKREYQHRKSGKNFGKYLPHFHVLVWGLSAKDVEVIGPQIMRKHVQMMKLSSAAAHEKALKVAVNRASYRYLKQGRHAVKYVTKYCTKEQKYETDQTLGRLWGEIGDVAEAAPEYVPLNERQSVDMRRIIRRYFNSGKNRKNAKRFSKRMRRNIVGETGFYFIALRETMDRIMEYIGIEKIPQSIAAP